MNCDLVADQMPLASNSSSRSPQTFRLVRRTQAALASMALLKLDLVPMSRNLHATAMPLTESGFGLTAARFSGVCRVRGGNLLTSIAVYRRDAAGS